MTKTRISDKWHRLSPSLQDRITAAIFNGRSEMDRTYHELSPSAFFPPPFSENQHRELFSPLWSTSGLTGIELEEIQRASGKLTGEVGCVHLGKTDFSLGTFTPNEELVNYLSGHGGPCSTDDPLMCFAEIPSETLKADIRAAAISGNIQLSGSLFDEWMQFQHVLDMDTVTFHRQTLTGSINPVLVSAILSGIA